MVTICADDFGLNAAVSRGILQLCEQGKINAASVMVEADIPKNDLERLAALKGQIQIGLHFNLTHNFDQKFFSRNFLILCWKLSAKNQQKITDRLQQQLENFERLFGFAPDFIDGHEHIHMLPSVRNIFLHGLQTYFQGAAQKPWIRQVSHNALDSDDWIKSCGLNVLNWGFQKRCHECGFATNQNFAGAYSLNADADFSGLLNKWLAHAKRDTVIMCHPALAGSNDALAKARLNEFNVFSKRESLS